MEQYRNIHNVSSALITEFDGVVQLVDDNARLVHKVRPDIVLENVISRLETIAQGIAQARSAEFSTDTVSMLCHDFVTVIPSFCLAVTRANRPILASNAAFYSRHLQRFLQDP